MIFFYGASRRISKPERKTEVAVGEISKRLHRRLASRADALPTKPPKRRRGEPLPGGVKELAALIKDGLDPVHAAYVYIQQISSHFAERVSSLPELKAYAKLVAEAEDEYLPSGPPMSPLTGSYFTCWAFYDLRFGRDGDTIATCQIDANDILLMTAARPTRCPHKALPVPDGNL